MQTEQLIHQIFQENFSKVKDSPLRDELLAVIVKDYEQNQEAIEKLKHINL
jgi:hypothetical protein